MPVVLTERERQAIGQRIATLRDIAGLTQWALGRQVGVTQPAVSQWETGATLPDRALQFILADALATTRSRLFREVAEAECAQVGGAGR